MNTYTVTTHREGDWWVFTVPDLDTGGQASSLEDVSFEARGVISAWTQAPLDTVDVTVTVG